MTSRCIIVTRLLQKQSNQLQLLLLLK